MDLKSQNQTQMKTAAIAANESDLGPGFWQPRGEIHLFTSLHVKAPDIQGGRTHKAEHFRKKKINVFLYIHDK